MHGFGGPCAATIPNSARYARNAISTKDALPEVEQLTRVTGPI
jgi:hypothetical protein